MLPGATKTKLDGWMEEIENEQLSTRLAQIQRGFVDVTPAPAELEAGVDNGAPLGGS